MAKKPCEYISLKEATWSFDAQRFSKPNALQEFKMRVTANKLFVPIREHFNKPIAVTSFFRDAITNKVVGGSKSSQHCKGEAIDINANVYGGLTNSEIFYFILDFLDFDQLIWEFGDDKNPKWLHVSYNAISNRKEVLRAVFSNGETKYIKFDL